MTGNSNDDIQNNKSTTTSQDQDGANTPRGKSHTSEILAQIANHIAESAAERDPETSRSMADDGAPDEISTNETPEAMPQHLEALSAQASAARDQVREVRNDATFGNAEAALAKLSGQLEETERLYGQAPEGDLVPGTEEQPWANDAAEELTALCEDAGLTTGRKKDDMLIGDAVSASDAPPSYVYLQPEPREIGQQWFEARFEEIGRRLDSVTGTASIAGGPASADILLEKFDALEARLEKATPQGGEGASTLQDIELCIAEIAGQLEQNTAELSRIETIETQVAAIAKTLDGSSGLPGAEGGSAFDATSLAEMITQQMAVKRMAFAGKDRVGDSEPLGIGELSASMKEFMRERRDEGEHANAVLDTMQQTILRVLDRMESLEANGVTVAPPMQAAPIATAPPARAGAPASQPEAAQPEPSMSNGASRRPVTDASAIDVTSDADTAASLNRLESAVAQLEDAEPVADVVRSAPNRSQPTKPTPERSPEAQSRADFIKAARQAAARASNQLTDESGLESVDDAELGAGEHAVFGRKTTRRNAPKPAELAINDDGDEHELDATNDGFSLSSLGARFTSRKTKKKAKSGTTRARLLVAALAIVAVGLGATKYMMSLSGDEARRQLQTDSSQQGSERIETSKPQRVGDVMPRQATALERVSRTGSTVTTGSIGVSDVMPTPGTNEVTYDPATGRLMQNAAVHPDTASAGTNHQAPVSRQTNSTQRKALPPATIGPLSMRLAAANGDPSAEFQVASRFADGNGVNQDFKESLKWYLRSAGRGFALAQYRLGTFYERGLGVDKDANRARIWYERAAKQNNIKAMHNLAVLAASATTTGKADYGTAAQWFQAAAERGLADSQFNLAILYQNGLGVQRNEPMAYKWFSLAGKSGDAEAGKRKNELATKLGNSMAKKLDGQIADWIRKPSEKMANDPHYAGQAWQRRQQS